MKNKLNIFFVSSEVTPFTHPGELGDLSGALPKYLKNLGHDIRVMMPNYKVVNERKYVLRDVIRLQGLKIKIGKETYEASAKSAFIPESKVQIYFLDNKHFFDRGGIYFDTKTGKAFEDNAKRYIFFCMGCLETLKLLYWQPDIIHCNDWATAIIPTLLKTVYHDDSFFKNTKTLLSIHNPTDQGMFEASILQSGGLADLFDRSNLENAHVNFLRTGLENADFLNPVVEASTIEPNGSGPYSNGISDVLKRRKNKVVTINRGIDEQVWNPEKDILIPFNYSRTDHLDKYKNKQELVSRVGLKYSETTPVISAVLHFLEEEANELILAAIEQLMKLELQLVIFGIGDERHYKKLISLQKKYPKRLALEFHFDNSGAHLILAGSDIYLMPYHHDWGGVNHLYGLMYGTIPIVGKTSGVYSVDNYNVTTQAGTGFVLDGTGPKELVNVVKEAIKLYADKDLWAKVMQNGMNMNFSWKSPAQQYVKLYQKLLSSKSLGR